MALKEYQKHVGDEAQALTLNKFRFMKNTFEEYQYLTTKEDKNTIYYPNDELLKVGAIESKNLSCPNCGSFNQITFGLAPMTDTQTKYPDKDLDMAYIWLQKHICKECETIYWIENGT